MKLRNRTEEEEKQAQRDLELYKKPLNYEANPHYYNLVNFELPLSKLKDWVFIGTVKITKESVHKDDGIAMYKLAFDELTTLWVDGFMKIENDNLVLGFRRCEQGIKFRDHYINTTDDGVTLDKENKMEQLKGIHLIQECDQANIISALQMNCMDTENGECDLVHYLYTSNA